MAYQFHRIEAVSNAGRDIYRKINGEKRKVGHVSVQSILGEADRLKGYISHIENPLPPIILYGDKERGIESVRQKIDEWVYNSKDSRGHKIRRDANCLLSGVISWPPIENEEDEGEYLNKLNKFESDMLEYLKVEYGENLVLVIKHEDEPFKGLNTGKIHHHWHYFCVKKPGERFDLHPGFFARSRKDISRKDRKNTTHEELKEAFNDGKDAYREAMVLFQDRTYEKLFRKHGLHRKGPCRLRRSRSEQVELEAFVEKELAYPKKVLAEAIELKSEADSIKTDAESIKTNAKVEAMEIIAKGKSDAEVIKETAKFNAEKIINNTNLTANEIKEKAWLSAYDITETAKIQAASIIESAKGFIDRLLSEVAKLQNGEKVVNWAKGFIKPIMKPNMPTHTTQNSNEKGDVRARS